MVLYWWIFVLSIMKWQTIALRLSEPMKTRDSLSDDSWPEFEEHSFETPCCKSKSSSNKIVNENSSQPNYVVNVNVKSAQNELSLLLWKEISTMKHQLATFIESNEKHDESVKKFNESLLKTIVKAIDLTKKKNETTKPKDLSVIRFLLASRINNEIRPYAWKKTQDETIVDLID